MDTAVHKPLLSHGAHNPIKQKFFLSIPVHLTHISSAVVGLGIVLTYGGLIIPGEDLTLGALAPIPTGDGPGSIHFIHPFGVDFMIPLCPIFFIRLMLIALVILETTTIGLVGDLPMETDSGIVMFRVIVEKKATVEIETIEIDNSSIAIKMKLRIK